MYSEGYYQALRLLQQASTPQGFTASLQAHDNYQRVWTRDGVVNGLAALLSGEDALIRTFAANLHTIFARQHAVGFMPSNVASDGAVSYGGTVGRADNPAWAVIGLCQYTLVTGDPALAQQYATPVERCLALLEAWEYNGKHLVYVPQSGDWADEYIQHGYILFVQLLRLWALQLAARVYQREAWLQKAEQVRTVIEQNFWNHTETPPRYAPNLAHQLVDAPTHYWFMGFNPSRIYLTFDLQANSLALLMDLGSTAQRSTLLNFIRQAMQERAGLLPSFFPTIMYNDWEMHELEHNYAFTFRNKPHEFHNGGLWPVWNGWLVAALAHQQQEASARDALQRLHAANAQGGWQFNECLHGMSQQPVGVPHCTWSAGGAVLATQYIQGKRLYFS